MSCKRTARRPPRKLMVTVESLAFGGDSVGHADDGRVVFVPGGAPGDQVEVEVEEEHKAWMRARLLRTVKPGPTRVPPPCPQYLAGCGGCQWLHVDAVAQRAAKEEVVRRALRHVAPVVEPIRSPGPDLGWRRRARLRWRSGILGYTKHRSHELVDAPACPQLDERLERALAAIRQAFGGQLVGSGDLELLVTRRGEVHVALSGPHVPAADSLVGQAGIAGILVGGTTLGADRVDLGDGDSPFWARADVFAQASAPGNDLLRALVREAAGPLAGRRVLELFAGSGNFTRDLLAAGAHVVAVEESAPASALAAMNLAPWSDRSTLMTRPAAPPLPEGPFDLVVVDPPRTGLDPELTRALAALAVPMIYVSCDPQTLARDLAGRQVERVVPVDLMPQTFHVEVVALVR